MLAKREWFSVIAEAFQSAKIAWRQGLLLVIQFSA
jgi:hypothetical protein